MQPAHDRIEQILSELFFRFTQHAPAVAAEYKPNSNFMTCTNANGTTFKITARYTHNEKVELTVISEKKSQRIDELNIDLLFNLIAKY